MGWDDGTGGDDATSGYITGLEWTEFGWGGKGLDVSKKFVIMTM